MNIEQNIKLYISSGEPISSLKKRLWEEDLNKINSKFPLKDNVLNIIDNYMINKENKLEVGVFIRNTFAESITLEQLTVLLKDQEESIISTNKINFKKMVIPSMCGVPFTITFDLPNYFIYDENRRYVVSFLGESLEAFSGVHTRLDVSQLEIPFDEEKQLQEYIENLSTLHKDQIALDLFKATKSDIGVTLKILIRNGYNKEVSIDRLPVTIENFNEIPVCKCVFGSKNGIIKVEPGKAKVFTLTIDKSKMLNPIFDLDKCKILFQ